MKVLIIDDDRTVCNSLNLLLSRKGFEVDSIHHPTIALETIQEKEPQLVLLDMNFTIDTSGRQGLKLLKLIRQSHPNISIILMTGWATVQLAVEGMKIGAKDFIAKPWDNKTLLSSINNIRQLYHNNIPTEKPFESTKSNIIGSSQKMQDIMMMVEKVAVTNASVLVTGESGTGKELIAEAIHQKSKRANGPFVKVNLGGIPNNLFESEMFGHKRGAFTGAHSDREGRFSVANNGTIFLDEIGDLELDSQVKLLRVLQENTFEKLGSSQSEKIDVRVLSATNKNLIATIENGSFREDLFYRINLINIHIPALRERREDIPELIHYFLENMSKLYGEPHPSIDDETINWLENQEYKGNIRQLKNIIERTFLLNLKNSNLNKKDFLSSFQGKEPHIGNHDALNLDKIEIEAIRKALAKFDHSISASARALGITRSSLYRRLEKYGIKHEPKI